MRNFKKIASAVIAAAAVGATSMIAFADTGKGDYFNFEFIKDEKRHVIFSESVKKHSPYSVPAQVTAQMGAKSTRPIEVDVTDSDDPEYYNTLTGMARITANYDTVYMDYYGSGTPSTYEDFYLNGYVTKNESALVFGLWMP